jgi:hypothetical protein
MTPVLLIATFMFWCFGRWRVPFTDWKPWALVALVCGLAWLYFRVGAKSVTG